MPKTKRPRSQAGTALFRRVPPEERVLLLSHCQRPSQTCPGKFSREGLTCPPGCALDCNLLVLRRAAEQLHYLGVCIAAGGAQSIRFVVERKPRGIVAIACRKELREGLAAVRKLVREKVLADTAVLTVPLAQDGCVDTTVDMDTALAAIRLRACGGI
jgi:hypothetical protein